MSEARLKPRWWLLTTVFAAEARVPSTSFSKALQIAKNRDDYVVLKSAKFDVKEKTYNISYVTKNGNVETLKISKISGKEVK